MSGECRICNEHCLDCQCTRARNLKKPITRRNSYSHKTINGVKKRLHRHIMEEHLSRLLESNEHVYHVNGDSRDNRLENLVLITKKDYKNP